MSRRAAPPLGAPPVFRETPLHALIIDDEDATCRTIASYVRQIGFDSFTFAPPGEAQTAASSEDRPQLIVADLSRLPEAVEPVRSISSRRWIPLVLVASRVEELKQQLPDAFVVAKPVDEEELGTAIRLALALNGL